MTRKFGQSVYQNLGVTTHGHHGAFLACVISCLTHDRVHAGIDLDEWNPAADPYLDAKLGYKPFSMTSPENKAACKKALQAELGLQQNDNVPLVTSPRPCPPLPGDFLHASCCNNGTAPNDCLESSALRKRQGQ